MTPRGSTGFYRLMKVARPMPALRPASACRFALGVVACVGVHALAAGQSAIAHCEWRREADLVMPRAAHAVVVHGDGIVVLGGTGAVDATAGVGAGEARPADAPTPLAARAQPILEVERFDGKAWSVVGRLPDAGRNAPAAVSFEGRIWLIGGFDTTSNVPVASVSLFDPTSGTWSEGPALPAPRGGHAAAVLDGRIHVLGGGNSQSTLADHCTFDPVSRRWDTRAPLARAKGSPAAVVFDAKLWAIGGRSGMSDFGEVEVFDPASDRWSPGPAFPARGTVGAAVAAGTIWVVGGESQAQARCLDEVLRLDPATRAFQPVATLPQPRNYARTVAFQGDLWVVGGSATAGASHASLGSRTVYRGRLLARDGAGAVEPAGPAGGAGSKGGGGTDTVETAAG